MSNPVVIIGLDGADPELISKWKEDLPNFQKIREKGFFGELESTVPPITVPAWMSMFSSKGPEYFGVYDFQSLNLENYEFDFVDSSYFTDSFLNSDKETISFRVPGTTPTQQINGSMVSGFVFGEELEFADESLEEEVRDKINPSISELENGKEKEIATKNFQQNTEVFQFLLENKEFDRAFSVFRITDTWMHNVSQEKDMKEAYLAADKALEEFIQLCEQNSWNMLVVSDHGSVNTGRKFYLNGWLKEKGYLTLKEQEETVTKNILYDLAQKGIELGFKPVIKKAVDIVQDISGKNLKPHKTDVMEQLKLQDTEAFSYLSAVSNFGAVWIHDKKRFSEGIVENREERAMEIKESLEKEEFIEKVLLNSNLYENEEMPDIIVKASEEVVIGPEVYPYEFHETNAVVHGFEGLITGFGPDISDLNQKVEEDLINIGATVQAIEGSVDGDNKGKPMRDILKNVEYEINYSELGDIDL